MNSGPLRGLRVLEFAGIGPGPFAAMLLADLGDDVVRIDRPGGGEWPNFPILSRVRSSIVLDLKRPEGVSTCLEAIAKTDVLIEGFRPGVMERIGLGPEVALAQNPKLIYARIRGWGQIGRFAKVAGHDINYIALAGALAPLGRAGELPMQPLNLLGDYAGGSLYLLLGILAALLERSASGQGQIIDAVFGRLGNRSHALARRALPPTIVDGVASMMAPPSAWLPQTRSILIERVTLSEGRRRRIIELPMCGGALHFRGRTRITLL
jgi:alpha-methylacyl-CoA racemase